LHARNDDPKNHLYTLDYSADGNILATAGKDYKIRLYDESTKSLVSTMAERGNLPGHTNRVYCVKFNPYDRNMMASGGWDHTLQIYDVREAKPVHAMCGPNVCGESIDFRNDGYTCITGSYK